MLRNLMVDARRTSSLSGRNGFGIPFTTGADSKRRRTRFGDLDLNRSQSLRVCIRSGCLVIFSFSSHAAATPPPPSSSDPGSQHDQLSSPAHHQPGHQRPTANDKDETEDEPAFVNVLPAVTLPLCSGLLERRGYQISDGEVILSPSKVKAGHDKKVINPPKSPHRPEIPAGESVISSFRRANSFAVARDDSSSSRPIPFKRAAT